MAYRPTSANVSKRWCKFVTKRWVCKLQLLHVTVYDDKQRQVTGDCQQHVSRMQSQWVSFEHSRSDVVRTNKVVVGNTDAEHGKKQKKTYSTYVKMVSRMRWHTKRPILACKNKYRRLFSPQTSHSQCSCEPLDTAHWLQRWLLVAFNFP